MRDHTSGWHRASEAFQDRQHRPAARHKPEGVVSSSSGRRGASRGRWTHGVLCHVERDLDMTLRGQVVDLRWPDLRDDIDEIRRVCEVAIVQDHVGPCIPQTGRALSRTVPGGHLSARGVCRLTLVHVAVQVLDAAGVERGGAADNAVDLVACSSDRQYTHQYVLSTTGLGCWTPARRVEA